MSFPLTEKITSLNPPASLFEILIISRSHFFLEHTFSVDYGLEPFRFIHWTVQAIPNLMNDDI